MKIVRPSAEIVNPSPFDRAAAVEMLKKIEEAGRTCYKSEDKITEGSAQKFIAMIVKSGHASVIEHGNITAKVICDRGVTHELVRHRLCAYSQESTRYCNYAKEKFGNEITVIQPPELTKNQLEVWKAAMVEVETRYLEMLAHGASPQIARSVLPNSLKTEITQPTKTKDS